MPETTIWSGLPFLLQFGNVSGGGLPKPNTTTKVPLFFPLPPMMPVSFTKRLGSCLLLNPHGLGPAVVCTYYTVLYCAYALLVFQVSSQWMRVFSQKRTETASSSFIWVFVCAIRLTSEGKRYGASMSR